MEVPGIEFNPAYKGQGIKTVLENLRRLKWVSKGIGWENEFEVNLEEEFLVSRIFGIEINDVASVWTKILHLVVQQCHFLHCLHCCQD